MLNYLVDIFAVLDKRDWLRYVSLALLMMISSLLQAVVVSSVPLFLSAILPTLEGQKANELFRLPFSLDLELEVQDFALIMFLIVVVSAILNLSTVYYGFRLAISRIPVVSRKLLEKYLHRGYQWQVSKNTSDLVKRVVGDVGVIISQVVQHLIQVVAKLFDIVVIFGVLLWAKPLVAVTALCGLAAVYSTLVILVRKHVYVAGKRLHQANARRFITAKEALDVSLEAGLVGRQAYFLNRFNDASKTTSKEMLSIAYIGVLPKPLLELCLFGGIFLGVAGLYSRGWNASAIVPLLSLYAAAGIRLLPAAQQIYFSLNNIMAHRAMVVDVVQDLRHEEQRNTGVQVSGKGHDFLFRFKDVGFTYSSDSEQVLTEVNFDIHPCEKIAFVGHTGSGKSTLMSLLLGVLQPVSGQVTAGSSDILVGYVPQKVAFIDGTIGENIGLGVPKDELDRCRLEEACRRAQAWEFVSKLPLGLDHQFGEDASRLSGGQRQRIGIARALYHRPKIVVLDEASSALDARTEKEVLFPLFQDAELTVVLITHRLNVLTDCDRVLVLENGRIVGIGETSKVIQDCPQFAEMISANLGSP